MELRVDLILIPTGGGFDQCHCRLVAVFGLAADKAHRFVDEDGDALRLFGGGLAFHADALVGQDLGAEHVDYLAIDADPAFFYPFVSLPALAEAEFGHAFGEAYWFG